jgi:hypothetical protein
MGEQRPASDQVRRFRERRRFLKAAIRSAGIALAVPTVLSVVTVDDLRAQVSPGNDNDNDNGNGN